MSIQLRWPVDSRRVNQAFNVNAKFYQAFSLPGHEGLDLFAPDGANIYAAADGEVYQAGHPDDHPYGLHIRIRHRQENTTFTTIYAHLRETHVQVGRQVRAGERIGLADNSGNSFGAHLHFTLKIDGQRTAGFPPGIVDPLPYLQDVVPSVDLAGLAPSDLILLTKTTSNLRAQPTTASQVEAVLGVGEPLTVLGDPAEARRTLGADGWIPVVSAGGAAGFVHGSLLAEPRAADPTPSDLVVYPVAPLNLRAEATTASAVIRLLNQAETLVVLGDGPAARDQVGREGAWLQVRTGPGETGYVSARYVTLTGQIPTVADLKLFSTVVLNIRARPTTDSNRLTVVLPQDALEVLGDAAEARERLGRQGEWIHVRTPAGHIGYAAAHYLRPEEMLPFGGFGFPDLLALKTMTEARLHAQASQQAPARAVLPAGSQVSALETDYAVVRRRLGEVGGWVHVLTLEGDRGWIASHLLAE